MPKKSKKPQNESEAQPDELTESASAEKEASASESEISDPKLESTEAGGEPSMDDLLEDVRRSLMEEEAESEEKKPKGWWQRAKKGKQKDRSVDTMSYPVEEPVKVPEKQQPEDAYVNQIDELIDMLDADTSIKAPESKPSVETQI